MPRPKVTASPSHRLDNLANNRPLDHTTPDPSQVTQAEVPPMSHEATLHRVILLEKARETIVKEREDNYGSPENSFKIVAALWQAYLEAQIRSDIPDFGIEIKPADVAAMMALLKVARIANTPDHDDSWVDLAGYAACGYEVSKGDST